MTKFITFEQLRNLRLRSQRLHPETAQTVSSVAQLVKALGGIQAQELPSATLAFRPRSRQLRAGDVRQARVVDRSIVMTWCMRGTLHLVAAGDLGWLLPLFGPLYIQKGGRRYRQLGLDPAILARSLREIRDSLGRRGPLIRSELAEALAAKGIPVQGQAIAHLVGHAALQGVICVGPERDGDLTYVLLEDWVKPGKKLDEKEALSELAYRYLDAYGPVTVADFAGWAGISMSQAKSGFSANSGEMLELEWEGSSGWMLKRNAGWLDMPQDRSILRLLPRFDDYLLGYRSRDFMVSGKYAKRVHPGGGMIKATVILDGQAVGNWKIERKKNSTTVVVEPFESLPEDILPLLNAEAQEIGRFFGEDTALGLEQPG